jgi:hypothetical protein
MFSVELVVAPKLRKCAAADHRACLDAAMSRVLYA